MDFSGKYSYLTSAEVKIDWQAVIVSCVTQFTNTPVLKTQHISAILPVKLLAGMKSSTHATFFYN